MRLYVFLIFRWELVTLQKNVKTTRVLQVDHVLMVTVSVVFVSTRAQLLFVTFFENLMCILEIRDYIS